MVAKKKKETHHKVHPHKAIDGEEEAGAQRATVVTQVVEEVDGPAPEAPSEQKVMPPVSSVAPQQSVSAVPEVPGTAPVVAPPASAQVIAPPGIQAEAAAPEAGKVDSGSAEVRPKQVVEELFKTGESMNIPSASDGKKSSLMGLILWAVLMVFLTVGIGMGLVYLRGGKSISLPIQKDSVSPTPSVGVSPTASPSAEVSKAALKIQVLNGGGVRGAATTMKELLETKGYTVADIGNADRYDYEQTEIAAQAGKESAVTMLQNDIKDSYSVGTSAATLDKSTPFDVRIIVGKE